MDYLDDIPLREDVHTSEQENEILREYFGSVPSSPGEGCTVSWGQTLKISGYGVVLFSILGNPWINNLFYKIPYFANNPILTFCAKIAIFMLVMFILTKTS